MRWVLHQIRQKSGGGRPNKHSWSAHPLLILRRPEHFNSQLKFAGWSADVSMIHSSFGHLAVTARRPKGHRRKLSVMSTKWPPLGRRTDACGWPLDHLPIRALKLLIVTWSQDHRTMPVRSSSGHPRCPLGMCCACVLRCYMYYMFIKYIEWYCIIININYWLG